MLAESVGSSFLAPFEAARIRLVTNPAFADGLLGCTKRIYEEEGMDRLFLGLAPILAKQVRF